jgi:predicted ATPase
VRVTEIKLHNFKRFTDLVIRDIPETAKLVVVVGPNGCGKSSLFDALLHWYRANVGFGVNADEPYFRKDASEPFNWQNIVDVKLAGNLTLKKGSLYIRTAYRNDPDFSVSAISRLAAPSEQIYVSRFIENDQTVSLNYQRLVYDTMSGVYDSGNDSKSVAALREELVGQVRSSMRTVFGDLNLNSISDPLGGGAFFFQKGTTKSYHYKNLSGGEKAAFDLLLDIHVKRKYFDDAIYCIDEIETHLHTRVQGKILREITKIVPNSSQLWITTHSLGVIRAAQEMAVEEPGSVCVIDFDVLDPDVVREIVPSNLGRIAWEKMLSVALDDLSERIAPSVVVVCEGSSIGSRRKDFDAEIYNRILGGASPDVIFVSGGSSAQVAVHGVSIRKTLEDILPTAKIIALCDRDDKSEEEVRHFESRGDLVLSRRNLESFLFEDDVIEALLVQNGKQSLLDDALRVKADAVAASIGRGNPGDDLKSASGEIYVGLKKLLNLQRCGNNTDTFMRDTLAPLVVSPMHTFLALKQAVLDRIQA